MNEFEESGAAPKAIDLERLSIDELKERIETLGREIEDCQTELKKKSEQITTANSLFSSDD